MLRRSRVIGLAGLAFSCVLAAGHAHAAPYFRTAWGSEGSGDGQFAAAQSIAIDRNTGSVYVSDQSLDRVQKFDAQGNYLLKWGTNGTGNGQFRFAMGLAVDNAGNVYVCDMQNSRVQKFDPNGNYLSQFGTPGSGDGQFNEPFGIAINAFGEIYVVEQSGCRVQKFTSDGVFVTKWGSLGTANGQFQFPRDIAVDAGLNVYVCDTFNHRIQKFDAAGNFLAKWGTNGTGDGQFAAPAGIGLDPSGFLYVGEFLSSRVQKFRPDGTYLTKWISGGAGAFSQVADVAANDIVYVLDGGVDRVQSFVLPATGLRVSDIAGDQGGQVRLRFAPASTDMPGSSEAVTGYEAYRRIGLAAPSFDPDDVDLTNWDYVASIPAHGESEYNVVVPTLADSTAAGVPYSTFLIRSVTADRYVFMDSDPESSYSVDNLAPLAPTNFRVTQVTGDASVELMWDPSEAPDFARFDLHRSSDPAFVPSAGNRIAQLTGTQYFDPQGAAVGSPVYYKLIARDDADNASPHATANTAIVGVGSPPATFALLPIQPNPTTAFARVRFDLPRAGSVSLSVHDVRGRIVWQGPRAAAYPAGASEVKWNLQGLSGNRVPAGFYLVRLTTNLGTRTSPLVVLD